MTEPSTLQRRIAPALAALALCLVAAPVWAADAPAGRAQQQAAFQAYTDAWTAPTAELRLQHLKDGLAAGMSYQDASTHAEGVTGVEAMISRFRTQSPGVTLRLDDMLLWADHGLARWSMMDPKGGLMMHGYDAVTFDPSGHIKTIVGFFDVPGQRSTTH